MLEHNEGRSWDGWVKRGYKFAGLICLENQNRMMHISQNIQNIGKMDIELIELKKTLSINELRAGNMQQTILLNELSFKEYLWVIATFEVLRVVREFALIKNERDFEILYELFKKTRIPLAKTKRPYDTRGCNYTNNYDIPVLVIHENDVVWQISSKKFISRGLLADKMYNFFK
jgi:hypothetical protein